MEIYYINNNNSISMSVYALRLWQCIQMIMPDWVCKCLFPPKENIACSPNKYLRNFSDFVTIPLFLKFGLGRNKYALFHITDHSYAYLIDHLPREKAIITCHDLMIFKIAAGEINFGPTCPNLPASLIKRNIGRIKKIGRAASIVAVSQKTKQDMVNLLGIDGDRIEVIYSGLNYSFAPLGQAEKAKKRAGLGLEGKRLILCVGSNSPYKNLEGVIEASAINKEFYQKNDVIVIKVGSDFSNAQRKLIDKYGLQPFFIYLGYIKSFADLNALYNIADIFLFPSYYEGFGWPPLEAMACGTPVIASQAGSLKEALDDAAFTVDPGNYDKIAQAIRTVVENEALRNELVGKGIANAARFSWQDAAAQYARLYKKVGVKE